ncbi:choline dehydrogenase [Idiomarina seosinensis]|uniref:Choline dehydrogenase n=1 Tax=Idiomarina seosinensis TaxID=281739 RepID=A0A432ZIE3_9GAMM|nr:choline dehydrogenase [Idiomarina seosinensis]RUO77699.1 choline dehydrogenase [Idiomarina seosinensis]
MSSQHYDYVIVGAGSAGCVLANRLTEDKAVRVLLLETGGSDKSIFIQMPTALSIPMNTKKYAWQFHSEPEPYLNNREMHCPRGKVLGGSSSINGMVYVRGHARDFDEWAELGAENWDYQNCLPYFKKSEDWAFNADDYRAKGGPLAVNNGNNMRNPLYRAFIDAGEQAGYWRTEDYNGGQQEGFGAMHMTVKNGRRWSTANAYLRPAMQRDNLTVRTKVQVERILLEDKKAVGVAIIGENGKETIKTSGEVILSAGPIGSPQLLQVSGIGPKSVLEQANIELKHELPGVGENLQDHLEFYFQYRCQQPISLNGKLGPLSKLAIGVRWILFKTGLGATNHFESCGFIRSKEGVEWPDLQYHFLPAAIRYDGKSAFNGHGFQLHIGHNKPKSRGWVRVQSDDVTVAPKIQFNYLQAEEDIEAFRACVRLSREIIAQSAMDPFRGDEIQPGKAVQTDEQIDAFVRDAVESAYHPCGSCRMGAVDDPMAVVDPETKVRGISGLRVVDSSLFPTIPNGNLNAPTIMLAERAADLIKSGTTLAAANVSVVQDSNWNSKQRQNTPAREVK